MMGRTTPSRSKNFSYKQTFFLHFRGNKITKSWSRQSTMNVKTVNGKGRKRRQSQKVEAVTHDFLKVFVRAFLCMCLAKLYLLYFLDEAQVYNYLLGRFAYNSTSDLK